MHLTIGLLGRLDTSTHAFICKSRTTQDLFLMHVSVAVLLTCRVFGVAKLRTSTHGE